MVIAKQTDGEWCVYQMMDNYDHRLGGQTLNQSGDYLVQSLRGPVSGTYGYESILLVFTLCMTCS